MSIKKVAEMGPVTTREIQRLNREIQLNTAEIESKQRQMNTIRAVESAMQENQKSQQVVNNEVDWKVVHTPTESEKYPLAKKINPEDVAVKSENDKAMRAIKDEKDWRIVSNPNEDKEHPLIKDSPAQIALKKLNII